MVCMCHRRMGALLRMARAVYGPHGRQWSMPNRHHAGGVRRSNESNSTSKASRTPGPPACDTYSSSRASARGLAMSHRRSCGACRAMCQRMSGAVAGSQATRGVSSSGGAGGLQVAVPRPNRGMSRSMMDSRCVLRRLPEERRCRDCRVGAWARRRWWIMGPFLRQWMSQCAVWEGQRPRWGTPVRHGTSSVDPWRFPGCPVRP